MTIEGTFARLLDENGPREWVERTAPDGVTPHSWIPGATPDASFEVALASSPKRPTKQAVLDLWKLRSGDRGTGVVLAIDCSHSGEDVVALAGPNPESPVTYHRSSVVQNVLQRALDATTSAEARLIMGELAHGHEEDSIYGLRNSGLFSWHSLKVNTPQRTDWDQAARRGADLRGREGNDILKALGWTVEPQGEVMVLRDHARERAIAVLLSMDESFDRPSLRYDMGASPAEHAISVAHAKDFDWVLAVHGTTVRLYAANLRNGVARAGTATYVEVNTATLVDDHIAYAPLLLSPEALGRDGSIYEILEDSRNHATALGTRLRDRIYKDVVGELSQVVARRLGDVSEQGLKQAYHVTLVILFRLLFVAYAEDRKLLPFEWGNNGPTNAYSHTALKTIARSFTAARDRGEFLKWDDAATTYWDSLRQIWRAVYHGNTDWKVPAYGGNLFQDNTPTGEQIDRLALTNAEIGPALLSLLVDTGKDGTEGPVDFQSLSVREFGTIYEGLLESSLSVAPVDLTTDPRSEAYIPAKEGDEVRAQAGAVYFHNASGTRKATGSYFTKSFAVEHLLEKALDPTIDEHLKRVKALVDADKQADAHRELFSFHVADIAMGSGHFLVGAASHIAEKFEVFLAQNPIAAVEQELGALREAAKERLAEVGRSADGDSVEIRTSELLLRQVAKRCIYGVDINEIAVELARLALWIHTFVPGLPMSSLDHGLRAGNSLTGVGSVEEFVAIIEPDAGGQISLFYDDVVQALSAADESLKRAALLAEISLEQTEDAEALHREARTAIEPLRKAMDAAVAARLGVFDIRSAAIQGWEAIVERGASNDVVAAVGSIDPLHFPVSFPEVFHASKARPGFDVILGNPPWDEVMVEEPKFWQRYEAGVMGLDPKRQKRRIAELREERAELLPLLESERERANEVRAVLLNGPYPGLGTGDLDYYQVFAWRYADLLAAHGRLGVVFPRTLLNSAGMALWRERALAEFRFDAVVALTNTRKWVFAEVHPQYTCLLLTLSHDDPGEEPVIALEGPFHSLAEFESPRTEVGTIKVDTLLDWGNGAAFPVLPSADSATIFEQMRLHPRFDAHPVGEFRPVREFDATNDRTTFDAGDQQPGRWPVFTGATFSHWKPDFGEPYAWADPDTVANALFEKRKRQARNKRTAFYGLPEEIVDDRDTLPCFGARIAFRDVARSTDERTVISCLLPPHVVLTNKAPYLFPVSATPKQEAGLLGVMSSIPFDWYARRFVEVSVNLHILNAFPVPRFDENDVRWVRVVEISGTLAAIDQRFGSWAAEVGVPVGGVDAATKEDLVAELDALVSHLYGLEQEHVEIVFSTFQRGWDYQPRLERVLEHYNGWDTNGARE